MEPQGSVAVPGVKVRNGVDQERVGRRGGFRFHFSRVCSGVSPPASQGTAGAGEAAAEHHEQEEGGEGRDQDVQPSLRLQLGPTPTQTTEEQDVLKPLSLAGLVPAVVQSVREGALYLTPGSFY